MPTERTNEDVTKPETIGMLLDIEHIYGQHESRSGPIIGCLIGACMPPFFYVYVTGWNYIPIWLFVIFDVIFTVELMLIVLGKQRQRTEKFKKQLYSDYSEPAELMNIRTIHPDGCIEMLNGNIYYYVVGFNGTCDNEIQRSVQMKKFISNLVGDCDYDTYIVNINDSQALHDYYEKAAAFNKSEAALNFVRIIDHSIDITENSSLVLCTIFAIKGTRSSWKTLVTQIDMALGSKLSRVFKECHRVTDPEEVNSILNRNADTVININELLRHKYATQQYSTSKVIAYDLPDDSVVIQGGSKAKRVLPEELSAKGFQQVYKEK